MKYRLFAALVAVFACFPAFAQSVTGVVTDTEGEPVVAASVRRKGMSWSSP